jgi:hypothetical protein
MMISHRRRGLVSASILGLAFLLRLYHLDFQSIWWDEGHSIFVAGHPLAQIPTLPAMDVHPPAYFALLRLWQSLAGSSEFSLRYLSVIFSLLTVALLWRFAASISQRAGLGASSAPAYTALLAALSPLYVAYAQEVRSYAMITFLALSSTYLLWRIIFPSSTVIGRRRSAVTLYVISTAACLYTHYFTIFLLLFQNVVWLVWVVSGQSHREAPHSSVVSDQWSVVSRQSGRETAGASVAGNSETMGKRFAVWATAQIGILLLFAPQLLLATRQITSYTNPNLTPPTFTYFISHSWQAYTVGLTIDPTPARWGMWLLFILVSICWAYLLIRNSSFTVHHSQFTIKIFLFLIAWLLIPLVAYFLVLQRQPSFEPRYLILVTPALFLLLALGVIYVSRVRCHVSGVKYQGSGVTYHASRITFQCAASLWDVSRLLPALPILIFLTGLFSYYTNPTYFKDNSAGVARWLATETTANDIVYVDVPHPFHYYANRREIPAPLRYLFVDIHTAADILSAEAAGRDRLFWITWRGSDTDPRGVIPFLAQKFGQQLGRRDFRGYQVTWYSLPAAGTRFSLPADLPPTQATFGDVLRLEGAAYGGHPPDGSTVTVGQSVWATLHFSLLRDTEVDYRVSLRLQSPDGQVVAQVDQDLLNDRHFRTSAWPLDDPTLNQAINVYTLPVPLDAPPGDYQLTAVVYNAQPPYPSEGAAGPASADGVAALIGTITIIP